MRRRGDGHRMYSSIMAQLGAGFNGYGGPCETTGADAGDMGESAGTDAILQRLKAAQISPLTAPRGTNGRRRAAADRRKVLLRRWADASEGAKLFCARKAPRVRPVSPAFIRANLTQAFEDTMATHNSLPGGLYSDTETRGELFCVCF